MDPIHPIAPGPPAIPRSGSAPVERPERISRERDRPSADQQERRRRRAPDRAPEMEEHGGRKDDGEHPHVDVRV